jgi:hypothetical protein
VIREHNPFFRREGNNFHTPIICENEISVFDRFICAFHIRYFKLNTPSFHLVIDIRIPDFLVLDHLKDRIPFIGQVNMAIQQIY